jgi:type II secretory pathway pseudopilin PulG
MTGFKKLTNRGDTIIEVLIVLAVLSLAFAISSATASKSLTSARNSEEHSRALGQLTSQVEMLRTKAAQQDFSAPSGPFCMTSTNTYKAFTAGSDVKQLDSLNYPSECIDTGQLYYASITYNTAGYYELNVRWQGLSLNSQIQDEKFLYRVHPLTATADSGIPLGNSPAKVRVFTKLIAPDTNTSVLVPSCTSSASGDASMHVRLQNKTGTFTPTYDSTQLTSSGVAVFDVSDTGSYSASFTASDIPTGYTSCDTSLSALQVSGTDDLTFKFTPHCYNEAYLDTSNPHYHDVDFGKYVDGACHPAETEDRGTWVHESDYIDCGTPAGAPASRATWTDSNGKQHRFNSYRANSDHCDNWTIWAWAPNIVTTKDPYCDPPTWQPDVHPDWDHPYYDTLTRRKCPGESGYVAP